MVVHHLGIAEVELCQQVIPAPVVIGEAVVVLVVVPEVDAAVPVLISRLLSPLLQVAESEEVASAVVEHGIQYHPDSMVMAVPDKVLQVPIAAETPIQTTVVRSVIAVAPGLKERPDVQARNAELLQVLHPRPQLPEPVFLFTIGIGLRCSAEPQRIDVIKESFVIPCHIGSPVFFMKIGFILQAKPAVRKYIFVFRPMAKVFRDRRGRR